MAEHPDVTMDRLRTQNREMRLRLEQINLIACYITEENTDARQEGLIEIGKLARGEPSLFMRFAEAVSPPPAADNCEHGIPREQA